MITECNLELSKNLQLTFIEDNNVQDGKLLAVVCYFDFFDSEGTAHISTAKLDSEYPSYGMTEIESDLSDSFNSLLEDYWFKISAKVKEFVQEWQLQESDK